MDTISNRQEIAEKLLYFLVSNFEKVSAKETANGFIYVKIYNGEFDVGLILSKVKEYIIHNGISYSEHIQEPPFINDGINAIELMFEF